MLILIKKPYGYTPEKVWNEAPVGCGLGPNIHVYATVYHEEDVVTDIEERVEIYCQWVSEHVIGLKYRDQVEPTQSVHGYQNHSFGV